MRKQVSFFKKAICEKYVDYFACFFFFVFFFFFKAVCEKIKVIGFVQYFVQICEKGILKVPC